VDKSLVLVDKDASEPRYRLLETIRQYGRERLAEAEEVQAAQQRHLSWCVELAARAEPDLLGPRQVEWLNRLEVEKDNLRTALEWGLAAEPGAGARLAGHLWQFWYFRTQLSEGIRWLDAALVVAPRGIALYAKLLAANGLLLRDQSGSDALDRSKACSEEAVALCRRLGEDLWCGWALNNLGCIAVGADPGRCRALQEEGVQLFRSVGNRAAIGMGLRDLATAMWGIGDSDRAQSLLEESLAILREVGDCWNLAWTLSSLADVALHRKDYARARVMARESLGKFREIGNAVGFLRAQIVIVDAARLIGELDEARDMLRDALMPFQGREMGPTYRIDWCLLALGMIAIQQGDPRRGVTLLGTARSHLKVIVNKNGVFREKDGTNLAVVADSRGTGGRIDVDREEYETSLTLARSVLREDVFELAQAEGEAMTRQQAIAYALGASRAD
jgi:non-specific serine/threonine protein kinase